jgi:ankyrin repeat protein
MPKFLSSASVFDSKFQFPEIFEECLGDNFLYLLDKINKSEDPNQTAIDGTTLLHIARFRDNPYIANFLIKEGAKIDQDDNFGVTPLDFAINKESPDLLITMLKTYKDLQINHNSLFLAQLISEQQLLFNTLQKNKTDAFKRIIDLFTEDDKLYLDLNQELERGETLLYMASALGNERAVSILLEEKALIDKANNDGVNPLFIACQEGHLKIVETLIKAGAKIEQSQLDDKNLLNFAINHESPELLMTILKAYKEYKINQGEDGEEALAKLIKNQNLFSNAVAGNKVEAQKIMKELFVDKKWIDSFHKPKNIILIKSVSVDMMLQNGLNTAINSNNHPLEIMIETNSGQRSVFLNPENAIPSLCKKNISERHQQFISYCDKIFLQKKSSISSSGSLSLDNSEITEQVPQVNEYNEIFGKEFAEVLLFLKFVASELIPFSSLKEKEKIPIILKLHSDKNPNSDIRFLKEIIDDKKALENLKHILTKAPEELIDFLPLTSKKIAEQYNIIIVC